MANNVGVSISECVTGDIVYLSDRLMGKDMVGRVVSNPYEYRGSNSLDILNVADMKLVMVSDGDSYKIVKILDANYHGINCPLETLSNNLQDSTALVSIHQGAANAG